MSERAADLADLIVRGGVIHSLDDANPSPQAFAVCGDRFAYVGSADAAMALRGPNTKIIDIGGNTVLPGLIDAHLHLTNLGLRLEELDLAGVREFDELIERAKEFARAAADEWIVGRGWDQNHWRGGAFPTHERLSSAIPDRPVALTRVDGHAVFVNARAMKLAGIDESTAEPVGGRILRDARGKPTGVLIDAAQAIVEAQIPKPTRERLVRATRAAIAECNRWGITAVAEPGCDDAVLAAHRELLERGAYSIRNYAMLYDEPPLIAAHTRDGPLEAAYGGRLWVRAIKMYADGALGSRGAALLEPYADDPQNSGLVVTARQRIQSAADRALRTGFQLCVHAIGDRANRIVLDAYESALQRTRPGGEPRFRIEHAQVLAPADIPRFAQLGVIASIQASHAVSDSPWARSRLGAHRMANAYARRSLLDSGARIANGSDAPVEPVRTPRTFHASISYAPQPMTRREALASMTIWAAYANFQERVIGSIAAGKYADFVIMDRDWMRVDLDEIMRTNVLATYLGGQCAFAAGGVRQSPF